MYRLGLLQVAYRSESKSLINVWKNSGAVEYTRGSYPKAPIAVILRSWVRDSWYQVSGTNVIHSINSAGFVEN